jgi:hypothetical protein
MIDQMPPARSFSNFRTVAVLISTPLVPRFPFYVAHGDDRHHDLPRQYLWQSKGQIRIPNFHH